MVKRSLHPKHWPRIIIIFSMITFCATLAVTHLSPGSVTVPTITFRSVNDSVDIVAGHPPPRNTIYGTHNFRQVKQVITEYDDDVAARLATLVERRSTTADPDLIQLIVDMLDPPSTHMVKMSRLLVNTPQAREVDKILNQKVVAS